MPLDQVPQNVRQKIGAQIKLAARIAAAHFQAAAANERSLTGALVIKFEEEVRGNLGGWEWKARAITVSEQPKGIGEEALGADFVFAVEVYENGCNTGQKLVLVQGKVTWDDQLLPQAEKMTKIPGGGIVADYRPGSYMAVRAEEVVRAKGRRRGLDPTASRELGDLLGDDFLACTIGTNDAYVTTNGGELVFTGREKERARVRLLSDHILRLQIRSSAGREQ